MAYLIVKDFCKKEIILKKEFEKYNSKILMPICFRLLDEWISNSNYTFIKLKLIYRGS